MRGRTNLPGRGTRLWSMDGSVLLFIPPWEKEVKQGAFSHQQRCQVRTFYCAQNCGPQMGGCVFLLDNFGFRRYVDLLVLSYSLFKPID